MDFPPQDQLDPGKPMDLSSQKTTSRQNQEVYYLSYQCYWAAKEIPGGLPEARVTELLIDIGSRISRQNYRIIEGAYSNKDLSQSSDL